MTRLFPQVLKYNTCNDLMYVTKAAENKIKSNQPNQAKTCDPARHDVTGFIFRIKCSQVGSFQWKHMKP